MKSFEEIKHILQRHKEELRAKYKIKEIGILALMCVVSRRSEVM